MTLVQAPHLTPFLDALRTAPTAPGKPYAMFSAVRILTVMTSDAKAAADSLAREVQKEGLQALVCGHIQLVATCRR